MSDSGTSNQLRARVFPQFFPAHWLVKSPDIIAMTFPSRIRIGYVVRSEGSYSFVMRPALESAGISVAELHEAALGNLRLLPMPELRIGETPGGPELYLGLHRRTHPASGRAACLCARARK